MANSTNPSWPELPYAAWRDTRDTLQLWTQIIGKIRLMQTPWLNHSWHVTLYVTSRGLTTSPIPHGTRSFETAFDFIDHALDITVSDGGRRRLPLKPQSVADFYGAVITALKELDVAVAINDMPCEIAGATAFADDRQHAAYDAEYAQRFWQALVQIDRVFKAIPHRVHRQMQPRALLLGQLRSGRHPLFRAARPELHRQGPRASRPRSCSEAYSHEVSSAGFWPGGNGIDYPAFYSYAYPNFAGFRDAKVQPAAAVFSETLGEFLLPYDAVRSAADPDAALLAFLQSTYEAAAVTAQWNRAELECLPGRLSMPRDA